MRRLSVGGVIKEKPTPDEAVCEMRSSSTADVDPTPRGDLAADVGVCRDALVASLRAGERRELPFRHWRLHGAIPAYLAAALDDLPFAAPDLAGVSGSRDLHNAARRYFDARAIHDHPACRAIAEAFQHPRAVAAIEAVTGARLAGTCLRIEYAQDPPGFWLKPHTDLGVKRFTLLHYLAPGGWPDLGTDLYADPSTWSGRLPFVPGAALAFVPSEHSWHGFEPRPMPPVRRSLIVNYVTADWRERGQLAFPDAPVRGAAPTAT